MTEALLSALLRQAALLSLALLLLASLRPLLKRAGAGALYASWLLLPAVLLTPALPRPATEPLRVVLAAAGTTVPTLAPVVPTPTDSPASVWLALWLAGASAGLLVQARRQQRLSRLGTRLPAGSSPALVGLLRPRVALPSDFEQRFSPTQQALILAHEQVHRERGDNFWNLLACLLAALHWWNPLAWWAARRFRADQELACDAAVLAAHPSSHADYAQALLAAHDLHHLGAPLASRWGTAHPLVERIAMLQTARSLSRRAASLLTLALTCAAGAVYGMQAANDKTPPVADGFLQLRFELQMSLDDKVIAEPRLVTFPSKDAIVMFSDASQERLWRLKLNGSFVDDKHLMIETVVGLNSDAQAIKTWSTAPAKTPTPAITAVANPRLLVEDGGQARVEATTPDGQHRLTIKLQVASFRKPTPDYSTPTVKPQPGTR